MGIARGLVVTFKHIFRPPITVSYPEETRQVPVRARTNLLWFEERCTGCSTCAQACPDGCILVQTSPREDGTAQHRPLRIDFRICMYCGLCTEACPYQAIQSGGRYDDAVYVFENMYRDKETLTREAKAYMAQTAAATPTASCKSSRRCAPRCRPRAAVVHTAGSDGPFGPQHLPGKYDRDER